MKGYTDNFQIKYYMRQRQLYGFHLMQKLFVLLLYVDIYLTIPPGFLPISLSGR